MPVQRLRQGLEYVGPRTLDQKCLVHAGVTQIQARVVEFNDANASGGVACGVIFGSPTLALASAFFLGRCSRVVGDFGVQIHPRDGGGRVREQH